MQAYKSRQEKAFKSRAVANQVQRKSDRKIMDPLTQLKMLPRGRNRSSETAQFAQRAPQKLDLHQQGSNTGIPGNQEVIQGHFMFPVPDFPPTVLRLFNFIAQLLGPQAENRAAGEQGQNNQIMAIEGPEDNHGIVDEANEMLQGARINQGLQDILEVIEEEDLIDEADEMLQGVRINQILQIMPGGEFRQRDQAVNLVVFEERFIEWLQENVMNLVADMPTTIGNIRNDNTQVLTWTNAIFIDNREYALSIDWHRRGPGNHWEGHLGSLWVEGILNSDVIPQNVFPDVQLNALNNRFREILTLQDPEYEAIESDSESEGEELQHGEMGNNIFDNLSVHGMSSSKSESEAGSER